MLGCDALFEYGCLTVDATGMIAAGMFLSHPAWPTPWGSLLGRCCGAYTPGRAAACGAHREQFAQRGI
ncbi:hypothetical protein [Nocardia aurea]|nr:hypothetical protein [Nocardia aurea]